MLLLAGLILPFRAHAEENFADTPPDEFSDLLDAVPEDIRDLFPDGLFSDNTAGRAFYLCDNLRVRRARFGTVPLKETISNARRARRKET